MSTHHAMNDVFQQLDKWRHFPAFPLEARSEVFFALFLPIVFEKCEGVGKINPLIIPQFPLKKEGNNQSNNVDFFALSDDCEKGYLIELKTDMKSRRPDQDNYLNKAAAKSMCTIMSDMKEIVKHSNEKQKYYHLLNALSDLGLIRLGDLEGKVYPKVVSGVRNLIDKVCICKPSLELEVVYIQPYKHHEDDKPDKKHHYIYFKEFAKIVEKQDDVGRLFACYLRKWAKDPAKHPPREVSDCKCQDIP